MIFYIRLASEARMNAPNADGRERGKAAEKPGDANRGHHGSVAGTERRLESVLPPFFMATIRQRLMGLFVCTD